MTRLIKSLLGKKNEEPSLEEVIAYNSAKMALQVRVEQFMRQGGDSFSHA